MLRAYSTECSVSNDTINKCKYLYKARPPLTVENRDITTPLIFNTWSPVVCSCRVVAFYVFVSSWPWTPRNKCATTTQRQLDLYVTKQTNSDSVLWNIGTLKHGVMYEQHAITFDFFNTLLILNNAAQCTQFYLKISLKNTKSQ